MAKSIIIENLSKQYQIGELHRETMLREKVINVVKYPFWRRKKVKSFWALTDVSASVEEGEVVGIIGRNGAGKSTLLKVLSKITYPTSGVVTVNGRIASLLEIGTGFHEELTGRENIYLNGSIMGMKRKEINAKLDAIVAFAGVERFVDTPIKRYSSGMRLRLGFAVAAHLDPDILLVDEVLAVGDVDFQKKCLKAMDDLRTGGRTVLFVSHNMAAIENLCPRTIWLDSGKVQQDGDTVETIKAYLSTFSVAGEAGFDLRQAKSRRGTGEVSYTILELLSPDGQPLKLIRSGDNLTVRLHYHAKGRISNPHFGVEFYTELGTLVTSVNTWSTGYDIPFLSPGDGQIDLNIDVLYLLPGRYYISLWLSGAERVSYDRLEHCATFDVEASDFYKSGKGIDRRFGIIFLPCNWKFDESQIFKRPSD